jgi:hypothetical protein
MNQQLINESTKYGLAIMVLVGALSVACIIMNKLWNQLKKTQSELMEVSKENTIAFQKLESTISMLVSILNRA